MDDVAAHAYATHRTHVYLSNPLDSLRDWWFGTDEAWGVGNVVSGNDINSNGTNELIALSSDQTSVLLFELENPPDSIPDMRITPANLTDYGYQFGSRIIAGDYNGDGIRDVGINLPRARPEQEPGLYLYWGGPGFDTIPDMLIRPPDPTVDGAYVFKPCIRAFGRHKRRRLG